MYDFPGSSFPISKLSAALLVGLTKTITLHKQGVFQQSIAGVFVSAVPEIPVSNLQNSNVLLSVDVLKL